MNVLRCHGGQVAGGLTELAAYKSWQDYIIAVKGNMRLRYLTQKRVGGISANLVDFVEWRFVVWLGP